MLGPESTGKTTLAAALARALGAEVSAEAARAYALAVGRPLTADDVRPIAEAQLGGEVAAEARAAEAGRFLVVRDTDLVSTATFAKWYYGVRDPWLDTLALERRAALYLLCDADLPWVPDPARDEAMRRIATRDAMRDAFVAALDRYGCAWRWVRGRGADRLRSALAHLREAGFLDENNLGRDYRD